MTHIHQAAGVEMHQGNSDINNQSVVTVLQSVMELNPAERRALRVAWDAISQQDASVVSVMQDAESGQVVNDLDSDARIWVDSIRDLPKRQQLNLLSKAISTSMVDQDLPVFEAAINELKRGDAVFSVEVAVTQFAYERPIFFTIGIIGFGLAIWRLGANFGKFLTLF